MFRLVVIILATWPALAQVPEFYRSVDRVTAGARKIMQFAFTVHDLKPVSACWAKLGLGPMAFNSGNLSDIRYWGKPIEIQQNFGWQRGRKVVYEWLQPVTSPNRRP
jgi:hypothetical protein